MAPHPSLLVQSLQLAVTWALQSVACGYDVGKISVGCLVYYLFLTCSCANNMLQMVFTICTISVMYLFLFFGLYRVYSLMMIIIVFVLTRAGIHVLSLVLSYLSLSHWLLGAWVSAQVQLIAGMTYYVSSGTFNSAYSLTRSLSFQFMPVFTT